jgi:hypothetical protein
VIDTEEKVWDRVFAVNVKGTAFPCKYGIPELLKRGGGSVINIASFVAMLGCPVPQDAYTASKGAIIALTKSLAVQFGPKGVRTNAICPGPIETPLLTEWLLKEPAEKAKRINRIPMGRFGRPTDIVNLALYLASDESTWTNGAAGLTLVAPAAYYVVTDRLTATAWSLWIANLLFAINQIQFVQLRIRAAHAKTPNEKFSIGRGFLAGQIVLMVLLALACAGHLFSWYAAVAFLPVLFRGFSWFAAQGEPLAIRALGMSELIHAGAFGILLILGLQLP